MNKALDYALAVAFLVALIPLGILCAVLAIIDLVMGEDDE